MSESKIDKIPDSGVAELSSDEDEISLLDLLITLLHRKRMIATVTGAFALGSLVVAMFLTPIFTGKATLLPPQQQQSGASALLGQLGGLAGLAGGAAGIKNPNDLYLAMLKSRTLQDAMIARFDLMSRYEAKFSDDARKNLEANTKVASGKDGIITIEVDDKDPQFSADMANGYTEELQKLTRVVAVTEASQRRMFFERQLTQAKDRLSEAEIGLKSDLAQKGIVKVDEQGKAFLEASARLRGQITAKEVQIGAMQSFASQGNPDLKLAQHELDTLKAQLASLEGGGRDGDGVQNLKGLENLKKLRDVKYFEAMYEILAKQYEVAKLDEAKEGSLIQVLDKALVPERKSKPKRALIVIVATLAGFFFAVLWAFIAQAMANASNRPETQEKMVLVRELFKRNAYSSRKEM